MRAAVTQVAAMQRDEVTDVVGEERAILVCSRSKDSFIVRATLIDLIDADGINRTPAQLGGEISVHIFIKEECYADGRACPCS